MLPPKTLCLLIVASLSTHLNSLHAGEDACLRIIQTGTPGHASVISTVASSPDGEWVAAGGDDHRLRIWHRKTGRLAHTLSGHRDWVRGIAFHPDGTSLFSVSKNGDVFKWNLLAPARPLRMVRRYEAMLVRTHVPTAVFRALVSFELAYPTAPFHLCAWGCFCRWW